MEIKIAKNFHLENKTVNKFKIQEIKLKLDTENYYQAVKNSIFYKMVNFYQTLHKSFKVE